jgi:hypothetical protein
MGQRGRVARRALGLQSLAPPVRDTGGFALISRKAELRQASPTPVRRVVTTAEPVTSMDVTSADMLADLGGRNP